MGRIFSYNEIRQAGVPEPRDFDQARDRFLEVAADYIGEGEIDGAFVFGSAAIGKANRRSDLDVFIALPDAEHRSFKMGRQAVQLVSSVPVNALVYPRPALEMGAHELDRLFGQHLVSQWRQVRGQDPAAYISFGDQPAADIMSNYFAQKKRRLMMAYINDQPCDTREGSGIQRMLELPSAIGRKALQALADTGQITAAPEQSADREAVTRQLEDFLGKTGIDGGYMAIRELDRHYDRIVDATVAGVLERVGYDRELKGLHEHLPRAYTWVSEVEEALLPKLRSIL